MTDQDEQYVPPKKETWRGDGKRIKVLANDRHVTDAEADEAAAALKRRPPEEIPEPDLDYEGA